MTCHRRFLDYYTDEVLDDAPKLFGFSQSSHTLNAMAVGNLVCQRNGNTVKMKKVKLKILFDPQGDSTVPVNVLILLVYNKQPKNPELLLDQFLYGNSYDGSATNTLRTVNPVANAYKDTFIVLVRKNICLPSVDLTNNVVQPYYVNGTQIIEREIDLETIYLTDLKAPNNIQVGSLDLYVWGPVTDVYGYYLNARIEIDDI